MTTLFYIHKTKAAVAYALMLENIDFERNAGIFEKEFTKSIETYRNITLFTQNTYDSISDAPLWKPYRLKACPYHWTDLLPRFEEEYEAGMQSLQIIRKNRELIAVKPDPYPAVKVIAKIPEQKASTVEDTTTIYTDRKHRYSNRLPSEFKGLNAIAFSSDKAMEGSCPIIFEVEEPVKVFVAFKRAISSRWAKPPKDWTLYFRGYTVSGANCDIYWKDYPAGRSTLEFPRGTFVVMGFTRSDVELPENRCRTPENFFKEP